MNRKNLKNLLGDLKNKLKTYKINNPKKFKYFIISSSGVAAITLTVVIVSASLPLLNNSVPSNNSMETASAVTTQAVQNFSAKTGDQPATKVSRGSEPSLDPSKGDLVKLGVKNSIVVVIQKRLVELDYLESDEPSEEFGEAMELAVKCFQRKMDLPITGEVDAETYKALVSDTAKEYTVFIGADGTDVEQLQDRLYELGYIPKVTGHFGTDTEAAVKEFQKRNGLFDDGNVGKNTREKLYSEDAVPLSFYLGDENDEILKYQKRLNELGYLTTKPDGKYGNDTVLAVKHFQDHNGIIADGYLGPATKEQLMSADAEANAIKTGDRGDDVTNVQKYLKKLGYLKNVTGYFGSDTHDAVINFQKRNGLSPDGKVGSQTINQLLSPDANKWNRNAVDGGSGNKNSDDSNSGGSSSGDNGSGGSNSGQSDSDGSSSSIVSNIISIAKSKLGSRYVYGAKGPNTFDCSGFVYWVLNQAGIRQSYMTSFSWQNTSRYQRINSMDSIKRGDIISYRGHVGIALGNGQMIDASSSQGKVRITSIYSSYWINHFECAYRIF